MAMRRRHRRLNSTPELDITAFMNLMIVLVPVLLLGMVFTQIRMIELDFPGLAKGEVPDPDQFRLEVMVVPSGMRVADSERGTIRNLPLKEGQQDFAGLKVTLKAIKQRMPDKTDIVLRLGEAVDYQTLVTAMDTVRSYPAVVAASAVEAELFPDVSLGDAPDELQISAVMDSHVTGGRP